MYKKPLISVISPVFQAEKIIPELVSRLSQALTTLTQDYEIILVEDGSADDSWGSIMLECRKDQRVKGIKLSRNFGQHYAISAGLDNSSGMWIIVMDCDLQDMPEEIPSLYSKSLEGYEIVLAKRINRTDSTLKKISSKLFYKVFFYLSGVKQDHSIANFGIYSKKVIEAVRGMKESSRCFPLMINWLGFRKTFIDVNHGSRYQGKTSYSWKKLFSMAIDISLSYSEKPLKLMVALGFIMSFCSIVFGMFIIYKFIIGQILMPGYASLILSIWLLSGLLIFFMGVLGLYIGKIFESVKNRPAYVIDKKYQSNEYSE